MERGKLQPGVSAPHIKLKVGSHRHIVVSTRFDIHNVNLLQCVNRFRGNDSSGSRVTALIRLIGTPRIALIVDISSDVMVKPTRYLSEWSTFKGSKLDRNTQHVWVMMP